MISFIQLVADLIHVLSYAVLIKQIKVNKSVHEISYRTQEMYLIVYLTRYGDILFNRRSLYLTFMKLLYIGITIYIIYLIKFKKPYCLGYDSVNDNFNHYVYLYPAVLVVTAIAHSYNTVHPFFEFCWSYSVWLEAVAIIPQIYVIYKKKEVEVITSQYLAFLGSYRAIYIVRWIVQLITQTKISHGIKLVAAIIQTGVYADLLYYFSKSQKIGGKVIGLPV